MIGNIAGYGCTILDEKVKDPECITDMFIKSLLIPYIDLYGKTRLIPFWNKKGDAHCNEFDQSAIRNMTGQLMLAQQHYNGDVFLSDIPLDAQEGIKIKSGFKKPNWKTLHPESLYQAAYAERIVDINNDPAVLQLMEAMASQ